MLSFCSCRLWLPATSVMWGLPAAHCWPFSDARKRVVVARRVFAVRRVSAAAHHQLLLSRQKTLLQTRLPTVSTNVINTLLSYHNLPCWYSDAFDVFCCIYWCIHFLVSICSWIRGVFTAFLNLTLPPMIKVNSENQKY